MEERVGGRECLTESEIEDLVRGKLSTSAEQRCQAHLLWCGHCQRRLDEEAEFAMATRDAAAYLEQMERESAQAGQSAGTPVRIWDRVRRLFAAPLGRRFSFAAVVLCAGALVFFVAPLRHAGEGAEVLLRSERGSAAPVMAAGRHVRLRIDVTDVGPAPTFTVTVAGAAGETVARTTAKAEAGVVKASFDRDLPPGDYWVRLATPDGRLLREYALRIQP